MIGLGLPGDFIGQGLVFMASGRFTAGIVGLHPSAVATVTKPLMTS